VAVSPYRAAPTASRWLWALAIMGAVALGAFVVTFVTGSLSATTASATVPDLTGRTQQNAVAALERAGLAAGAVGRSQKGAQIAGTVVAQEALPGTILSKGSSVGFTVTGGVASRSPFKLVPDVIGRTQAHAEKALRHAGYRVIVLRTPDWSREGTVLGQEPGGRAAALPGSTVAVIVSTGDVPPMSQAGGFP
jgi:eukaryotic-like serine/threonine-protein kinase